MKKEMALVIVSAILILSVVSFASAGLGSWLGKITGKVTSNPVNLNISISAQAPQIILVPAVSAVNLNEGPANTLVRINFTVYSQSGGTTINDSTSYVNLSSPGEALRLNATCLRTATYGPANKYVNFTCLVPVYWFDVAGAWNITAFIKDTAGASALNGSAFFTINALTGFVEGPSALTWAPITPGNVNQTSTNDPLLMNNTGNQNITSGNIQINSTNLKGESDNSLALYANNFSVGITTGGAPPVECGASAMTKAVFASVTSAVLPRGNFTINDGITGQEQTYFCLKTVGDELTTQAYSTAAEGAWTVKIA
jgi:hypothetical protein